VRYAAKKRKLSILEIFVRNVGRKEGFCVYNLIVFALCCFGVGVVTGFIGFGAFLVTVVLRLTKRKKPKH